MKIIFDNVKERDLFVIMLNRKFKLERSDVPNYYFNSYMKATVTNEKEMILTLYKI